MRLELNGKPHDTEAATLAELVAETGADGAAVATAHNGKFVPRNVRAETALMPGDRIEVLSPMQGG